MGPWICLLTFAHLRFPLSNEDQCHLQLRFHPWPGHFHMLWVQLLEKKKIKSCVSVMYDVPSTQFLLNPHLSLLLLLFYRRES